jgi:hypothetical protein
VSKESIPGIELAGQLSSHLINFNSTQAQAETYNDFLFYTLWYGYISIIFRKIIKQVEIVQIATWNRQSKKLMQSFENFEI